MQRRTKFKICRAIFSLFILSIFLLPSTSRAAILYMDPPKISVSPGQTFLVKIKVDPEGECINVVKADIEFSTSTIRLVDFSLGNSLFTHWVKVPSRDQFEAINKKGFLEFAGGIPGGYCGIVPGDPGKSDIIAELVFRVLGLTISNEPLNSGYVKFLDSSEAFLNDGQGTKAQVRLQNVRFSISKNAPSRQANSWEDIVKKDKTPPEPFSIQIAQNKNLFGAKYFIVFSTTDKQSGIDHYEIKEFDENGNIPHTKIKAEWQIVKSPYILKDQNLKSKILVKAVDKAWNQRVVEFIPGEHINLLAQQKPNIKKVVLVVVLLLVAFILGWLLVFLRRKKRYAG